MNAFQKRPIDQPQIMHPGESFDPVELKNPRIGRLGIPQLLTHVGSAGQDLHGQICPVGEAYSVISHLKGRTCKAVGVDKV